MERDRPVIELLNEIWASDFMADALYGWRPFRTPNVVAKGNQEALDGAHDPGRGAAD